jgi:hypothetical protein
MIREGKLFETILEIATRQSISSGYGLMFSRAYGSALRMRNGIGNLLKTY